MSIQALLMTFCLLAVPAGAAPGNVRIRALAFQPNGAVAGDVGLKDWKVTVDGRQATVLAQRPPAEMGAQPIRWALVVLPVQNADVRKLTLMAIAKFMETLPATDQVLLVHRGRKGLECLTPGFTTRPSLWAAGLDRLLDEFTASLMGVSSADFTLPPAPAGEAQEGIAPVQAFIRKLGGLELPRRTDDVMSRRNILKDYSPRQLGGITPTVVSTLDAVSNLAEALGRVPGDKQVVVFSRNEVDDLGSPIWAEAVARSGAMGGREHRSTVTGEMVVPPGTFSADRENNDLLQVQMMVTDVNLARARAKAAFARNGLTVHTVSGSGPAYGGALGEAAPSTGGHCFNFTDDLPTTLAQLLGIWTQCYELTVDAASGKDPVKVDVGTGRKDLKIIAPTLR